MKQQGHQTNASAYLPALAFVLLCGMTGVAQTGVVSNKAGVTANGSTTGASVDTSKDAASRALELKQADLRIKFWQAQVARDPENNQSYNKLASAYAQKARETGDISYFQLAEGALEASLKLESAHEDAAPAFTQLATVHLAEHRFREAGEDAEKAIKLLPTDLGAYPYAGDAQLELGNYEASQRFYARLTKPEDGFEHPGIEFLAASHGAGLDWIKGDTAKANEDLERAIKLGQIMHIPAENLAWTEFMLGEQHFMMGDLAKAEENAAKSLKDFPRYHRALAEMGQIRAAQGRYAEAVQFYKDAIAIIPLPLYLTALGDVYAVSGDKVNAEKQYATVEFIGRLNEINQQVYNRELALFYADHDRKLPEALKLAEKEFEVRHDVYTSDALAWALLKNGQTAKAKDEMEKALRMGTKDALMEYHAGMIYAALGDKPKSAVHLEKALSVNPKFHVIFAADAEKALAMLKVETARAAVVDVN
jgi:tetratricopeptide (TPR) repeat protein